MMRFVRGLALLLAFVALAVPAFAQGSVYGARFVFTTGPCTLRSGSGSPEGASAGLWVLVGTMLLITVPGTELLRMARSCMKGAPTDHTLLRVGRSGFLHRLSNLLDCFWTERWTWATVLILFGVCRPAHVAGLVVAVIVWEAIKRMMRTRSGAKLSRKLFKIVQPLLTDMNASAAVALKGWRVLVQTSRLHAAPDVVDIEKWMPWAARAMDAIRISAELALRTSTTALSPRAKRPTFDCPQSAAVASTVPVSVTSAPSRRRENDKMPETPPNHVNTPKTGWKCGRIWTGHASLLHRLGVLGRGGRSHRLPRPTFSCLLYLIFYLACVAPASGQSVYGDRFVLKSGPCVVRSGSGSPEGVVSANVCSIYVRTDGGAGTIVYIKESGAGNTGWKATLSTSSGAPIDATYVTQTANSALTNEQPLSALATGYLKVTTGTGVATSQAAPIPLADGGTNASLAASVGGIFYSSATAGAILAGTATAGKLVRSGASAAPTWSTATYPDNVAQGDTLVASGASVVGVVAAGAAGKVYRAAGAGTVPAWSTATYPDNVVQGDLLVATAASVVGVLPDVAVNQVVVSGGVGVAPAYSGTPTITGLTTTGVAALTTAAESWVGPSSTTGVYFKTGNVGIGTTAPVVYANQTSVTINGINYSRVDFKNGDVAQAVIYANDVGLTISKTGSNYVDIETDGTRRVRIDGSGSVSLVGTLVTSAGPGDIILPNATGELRAVNAAGTDTISLLRSDASNRAVVTPSLIQANYVSQTTAWGVTAAGAADFRYLFVDEMHAKSFIADFEQALAGGQIITKSVAVLSSLTCPAAGATATLTVEDLPGAADMQVFDVSDWVAIRTFSRAAQTLTIGDCVGQVSAPDTSGSGTQTWTFTRGSGGSAGTVAATTVMEPGQVVLDYGVSGAGYYEVNAVDGIDAVNSPYAQIVTWATAPVAANRTVRARYGNLLGITGTSGEYGLIAGTYAVTDGAYFRASNSVFELHGITAKWWDGATNVVTIAPNSGAPYLGIGNPAPSTCCTTAGIFIGWTAGNVAALSAYTDANNYLTFNGSKLTWKAANTTLDASGNLTATSATLSGAITASSGAIGGWVVTADAMKDAAGTVGMSSAVTGGDDIRFWAGHATPASAPFRLTEAGALTATSATITGAITANTGYIGGAAGGWIIGTGYFHTTAGSGAGSDPVEVPFFAGNTYVNRSVAPFRVTNAGALTATSATITGTVNATAGYFGDGATRVAIEAAGINVGNTGSIRGGQTAYATGTGFWIGYSGGAYKSSIGIGTTGNRITFDGTDVTITSANTTINSTGIAITPNSATWHIGNAYRFTTGYTNSLLGTFASRIVGTSTQAIELRSTLDSDDTLTIASTRVTAVTNIGSTAGLYLVANKSTDETTVELVSGGSAAGSTVYLSGKRVDIGSADLRLTQNAKYLQGVTAVGTVVKSLIGINGSDKILIDDDAIGVQMDGTLGVTGITTLTGLLNANGGIAVDGTAFTIADTTGAISTTSTANIDGAVTVGPGNAISDSYSGSLADDASVSIGTIYGHLVLYTATGYMCSFLLHGNGGATIASDPYSKCAVDSTDGRANVYWDGDELRIQNREGATYTYKAFWTRW